MHHNDTFYDGQAGEDAEELELPTLTLTFAFLMAGCIFLTIVGNILVVLSVFTYKPLRVVQNFYIVSLACADLAVAVFVMPFNVAKSVVGYWQFGGIFCNMWLTFDVFTCTASILNLCAIAVDRYYAIHDPITYAQKRTLVRVLIGILVVWLASAIISIPPLIGWNNNSQNSTSLYDPVNRACQLTDERGYVIYSASGSFYIPLFVMAFVYVNIYIATRTRLRARAANGIASSASLMNRKRCDTESTRYQTKDDEIEKSLDSTKRKTSTQNDEQESSDQADTPAVSPNVTPSKSIAPSEGSRDFLIVPRLAQSFISRTRKLAAARRNGELRVARISRDGKSGVRPVITQRNDWSMRSQQMSQFLEEKQRISLSKERRAARTMGIIMGAFVLCWLPFFLMYVIFPFCESCRDTDQRIVNFIVWLGYINSSLNPIIYTVFNIDFRRAFKALIQCQCRNASQAERRHLVRCKSLTKSRNTNFYTSEV